jgi:heptosyltransferase-2
MSRATSPDRVLIVAPAWVGDMVMAHAMVQLLVRERPGVHVHVLAPPATQALAVRMEGVADTTVLPVGHGQLGLGRRRAMGRSLASQRFAQAIVLPNTFKSALVPAWARIPRRTGWHGEMRLGVLNDRRRLDEARYPRMVERFMALALPPGSAIPGPYPQPALNADPTNLARLRSELDLAADRVLALCPGAEFGPAKRWPAVHYAAVARAAAARGYQVWLLGSPAEQESCEGIRALAPESLNLAGRTRLVDAVDLLSAADLVVCNDSGLMHVACAVGSRVIALFGSTSTDFTPPLSERARVLSLSLPCSPCFQRSCPLGHLRCLRELGPAQVIEAL